MLLQRAATHLLDVDARSAFKDLQDNQNTAVDKGSFCKCTCTTALFPIASQHAKAQ
jgi:hypothetical protein